MTSNALHACEFCGAAVANAHKHTVWHASLERSQREAVLTREELDYTRDQLADGELGTRHDRTT